MVQGRPGGSATPHTICLRIANRETLKRSGVNARWHSGKRGDVMTNSPEVHLHACMDTRLKKQFQLSPSAHAMDCEADKKQKVRKQPRVKRLEAPRKERLDLTFRVIPKTISVEAVASASGLSPEDVSKGLDTLRDTLVTNLRARDKYTRVPDIVRFRRTLQRKYEWVTLAAERRWVRKDARAVRKPIVKGTALKALLRAIA